MMNTDEPASMQWNTNLAFSFLMEVTFGRDMSNDFFTVMRRLAPQNPYEYFLAL